MKNALILHGAANNSHGNWFPWLERELKERGYAVWVPDLPRSDKPNIRRYNDAIFAKWHFDEDSVLVGHSSGAVAILGILQELPKDIIVRKAILVAGFTDDLGWESLRELFLAPFDWASIKKHARKIILFHSDNDPYVSLSHGEKLRDLLDAELIVMKGQKHFNISENLTYRQFPELLEKILE